LRPNRPKTGFPRWTICILSRGGMGQFNVKGGMRFAFPPYGPATNG
jgi:hypothetical protein